MTNHAHLVAHVRSAEQLGRFVKMLAGPYAQERNRVRGGSGKLFEERYFAKPIRSDAQLGATTAYIELNPEGAGIGTAEGYPWSTYGLHVGTPELCRVPRELWTPSPWYLSLGSTDAARQAAYRAFLEGRREAHALLREVGAESIGEGPRLRRPDGSSAA